jgi:hypothetical protein
MLIMGVVVLHLWELDMCGSPIRDSVQSFQVSMSGYTDGECSVFSVSLAYKVWTCQSFAQTSNVSLKI